MLKEGNFGIEVYVGYDKIFKIVKKLPFCEHKTENICYFHLQLLDSDPLSKINRV